MNKKRKLLLRLGWLTGIVLVLAAILVAFTYRYIDAEPTQKMIRTIVTDKLGKDVTYKNVSLTVFPRPGLAFTLVDIRIPETAVIYTEVVKIYPEILPLFIGKIKLAKIKFERPDIALDFVDKPGAEAAAKPFSITETVEEITSVRSSIKSFAPGLIFAVQQGKLLVRENKHDVLKVEDINTRIAIVPKGLTISFSGDVGRWGSISAEGEFYGRGNNVLINNLSVSTGESTASIYSAKLRFDDKTFLEIESGKAVLVLDDIYERRAWIENIYNPLRRIKKLKGTIKISSLKTSGALFSPGQWIINTTGSVEDIDVDLSQLPGPVRVQRGQFKAGMGIITLKNIYGSIFDSLFAASAIISGSMHTIDSAEVAVNANIGQETVLWVSKIFNLPPEQTVRAPLSVSDTHIIWQPGSNLAIAGNVALQNGPSVSFDLRRYAEEWAIKQLNIRDKDSHAGITFECGKNLVNFSFRGNLTEKALNRMFDSSSFYHGWIKGDFRAHILLDKPGQSSGKGYLEGAHLIIPLGGNEPLKIDHINLRADNKILKIDSAKLGFGDSQFVLRGDVRASGGIFRLEMDALSDGIKVDAIRHALDSKKNPDELEPVKPSKKKSNKDSLLQGIIRLQARSVTWGGYTTSPVNADILLDGKGVRAVINDAALCGVSLPGSLRFTDDYIQLDFKPEAENVQLDPALDCLLGKDAQISGIVDLEAQILTRGKSGALLSALQGKVDIRAKDGCIYRFPLLAKILSFLNVTELLRGKVPDLTAEGLDYNSIIIKGDLRNGKLMLSEAIIDGTTMQLVGQGEIDIPGNEIDLIVLVAPFKTVDYLVSKIPLVSYVLKGTLISIPLRITGKIDDPNIIVLSPTAIGKGVMGLMSRTLLLPVKIIEPVLPQNKEKEQ